MTFPVRTSLRAQNAFRAPGVVEGVTVLEQAIDELAAALELDPLELRRAEPRRPRPGARGCPTRASGCSRATTAPPSSRAGRARDALREPQRRRAPARDGLRDADLVGRRRPARARDRSGSTPTAARSSRPASRTSAPARSRRRGSSPRRSSGCRSTASSRAAATPARTSTAPVAGGSMTTPAVMPAVRSAAGKARQHPARPRRRRARDLGGRPDACATAGSARSDGALDVDVVEVTGKLGNATIDGSGRARPEPGRLPRQHVRLPDRAGRGRPRHRRRHASSASSRSTTSAGSSTRSRAVEPGRGRRDPGDRLRALRGAASSTRRPGMPVNGHLDDYKVPTIADVPEILVDFVDRPGREPAERRREGARRAADRPDRRGDRERVRARDRAARPPPCR